MATKILSKVILPFTARSLFKFLKGKQEGFNDFLIRQSSENYCVKVKTEYSRKSALIKYNTENHCVNVIY